MIVQTGRLSTMEKCALVTGTTSGIGKATAQALAKAGYDLIITGRREDRLENLKSSLENEFKIRVFSMCFDVRDEAACENAFASIPESFQNIWILVNNAGLALGKEHIQEGSTLDWNQMIDTNIKGLLYMSRLTTNLMIKRGIPGHIVNLGSIAGLQPYEGGNVYCATKHAVHGLSCCMRQDLMDKGIRVTEINPGMVETEFSTVRFHGDQDKADAVYKGVKPLTGADIASAILWAVTLPPHVQINQIVLTPTQQADSYYCCRK